MLKKKYFTYSLKLLYLIDHFQTVYNTWEMHHSVVKYYEISARFAQVMVGISNKPVKYQTFKNILELIKPGLYLLNYLISKLCFSYYKSHFLVS